APFGAVAGMGIVNAANPLTTAGATATVPLVVAAPSVVNVSAVTPTLSFTFARSDAASPAKKCVEPVADSRAVTVGFTVSAMRITRLAAKLLPDVSVARTDSETVCGACSEAGTATLNV